MEIKVLWKTRITPKVRIGESYINGFLPTKAELWRRQRDTRKLLCGSSPECSMFHFHVVSESSFARRFWDAVKDLTGLKVPAVHPLTWTGDVLSGQARWCGLASVRSLVRKIKIAAGRGWAGNTERVLLLLEILEPTIIRPCLVSNFFFMIPITSNFQTYAWSIKRSWKNNSYTI